MRLHRTPNTLPALLTVIVVSLTSFPALDLAAGSGSASRVSPAERSNGASNGSRTSRFPEVRSLHLPFAVPLFSDSHLAAA